MDDIARKMGISKKTVYKYTRNKADLVDSCCEFALSEVAENVSAIQENAESAIDELLDGGDIFGYL
jgi:AcrR family transcriptional regulator